MLTKQRNASLIKSVQSAICVGLCAYTLISSKANTGIFTDHNFMHLLLPLHTCSHKHLCNWPIPWTKKAMLQTTVTNIYSWDENYRIYSLKHTYISEQKRRVNLLSAYSAHKYFSFSSSCYHLCFCHRHSTTITRLILHYIQCLNRPL